MRRLSALAAVTVIGTASIAAASFGTAAHAATGNAVLNGSIPAWANSKNLVSTADPATRPPTTTTSRRLRFGFMAFSRRSFGCNSAR